jgi:hypothetical protein
MKSLTLFTLFVFFFLFAETPYPALGLTSGNAQDPAIIIFATDGDNSLIRQYDLEGQEVGQISNTALSFPTFLTADPLTRTLITDINFIGPDGPDIVRIDLQGHIVARNSSASIFGRQGGGIVDVIPSRHGSFFVTSTLNTQIAEVDQDLQVIRRFASGAAAGGLRLLGGTTSPDGTKLLVVDADDQSGAGFIRIYDTLSGAQLGRITNPALQFPVDLEFNSQDLLYVTDRGLFLTEDHILVFDSAFHLVNQFTSGAELHFNFGPFAILPGDNLALLETNFQTPAPIRILGPAGEFLSEFGDGLSNPFGIAALSVRESDIDGDGVPNSQDNCPNSILNSTVVIDGCNTGVPNYMTPKGCTILDKIRQCATNARNHGQFVTCVNDLTNDLARTGILTSQQKSKIQKCATQSNIP